MNTNPAAIALAMSPSSTYNVAAGLDRSPGRRASRPARAIHAARHRFRSHAPAL